jgi:AraC-like DNA-binding protein
MLLPIRQNTSLTRHENTLAKGLWSVLSRHYVAGSRRPKHRHTRAQLVFSTMGIMQVETARTRWMVLPQRALWVPPGHDHAIDVLSATTLRTVYFEPGLVALCPEFTRHADVHAVETSALIKELVLGLFGRDHKHATRQQMATLLLHALGEAACTPTHLPLPNDEQLRRVLLPLLSQHQWQQSIDHLAAEAALSSRSFTRRFTADVGMSFRAWRQQARLLASVNILAGDTPVKAIATRLGFSTSSSYVTAFRRLFGSTPDEFRRNHRNAASVRDATLSLG